MTLNARTLLTLVYHGYARQIIPLVKTELLRTQSPEACQRFCSHVLKSSWPEAEPIIARDGVQAFNYAQSVLRGRFPMGERAISMTNPTIAHLYAMNFMEGRFLLGEPLIMTDPHKRVWYANEYLELEPEDLWDYLLGCKYIWRDRKPENTAYEAQKAAYENTVGKYGKDIYAPRPEWNWDMTK